MRLPRACSKPEKVRKPPSRGRTTCGDAGAGGVEDRPAALQQRGQRAFRRIAGCRMVNKHAHLAIGPCRHLAATERVPAHEERSGAAWAATNEGAERTRDFSP